MSVTFGAGTLCTVFWEVVFGFEIMYEMVRVVDWILGFIVSWVFALFCGSEIFIYVIY